MMRRMWFTKPGFVKCRHSRLLGVLGVAGNSDAQSTHLCSECRQATHGETSARNACRMRNLLPGGTAWKWFSVPCIIIFQLGTRWVVSPRHMASKGTRLSETERKSRASSLEPETHSEADSLEHIWFTYEIMAFRKYSIIIIIFIGHPDENLQSHSEIVYLWYNWFSSYL